ncbi:potassium voltage-gated channel protein Shaw-like isoform X2 [Hydractinia symbiolongicarpus]|nr:potassium voltage-gated channel protein Shaw-like isoform X2 [Hydractinia symbiolongicarpus]XP_057299805.1 potassium voltage-gated channel protein Shaw-like isoform X2 [Hydractinia symbiolongicarpus]
MMEPCCWGAYTQHRDAHQNLRMFDEMHGEEQESRDDNNLDPDELENLRIRNEKKGKLGKFISDVRPKVWAIVERPFSSTYAQICALVSMSVIVLSLATFCMETMNYFTEQKPLFERLEYIYCAFFTVEFIVRFLCCPSLKEFFKSAMTWIDFVSTMQFYISFFAHTNALDFLFVSRLIRIFRLFRFFKNLSGMQVIGQTLKASANELFLLVLIVLIPMIIFSTLVYYAEQDTPDRDFHNIPETFWWAIVTMTTVGYGDDIPKSTYGKMIGAMCACSGVLIVALPVSVIGSNFTLYYSYAQARMRLPKRRSPALVSADKALMNSNHEQGGRDRVDSHVSPPMEKKGRGLAALDALSSVSSVLVDIAVPAREKRRHALQPSANPITKARKGRSRKHIAKGLALTDLVGMHASSCSPNFISNVLHEIVDTDEDTAEMEQESVESPKINLSARNKSLPTLHTFSDSSDRKNRFKGASNDDIRRVNEMKILSQSDDSWCHSTPGNTKKRVIHCDIVQYVPRKISHAELKSRRKLSQTAKPQNFSTDSPHVVITNGLDQSVKRTEDVMMSPFMDPRESFSPVMSSERDCNQNLPLL